MTATATPQRDPWLRHARWSARATTARSEALFVTVGRLRRRPVHAFAAPLRRRCGGGGGAAAANCARSCPVRKTEQIGARASHDPRRTRVVSAATVIVTRAVIFVSAVLVALVVAGSRLIRAIGGLLRARRRLCVRCGRGAR